MTNLPDIALSAKLGDYVKAYPGAKVGDLTIIEGFTQIWSGVEIGARVRVEAGVVFVKNVGAERVGSETTRVSDGVHLGAGSIIGLGVTIGLGAVIEPGTVVLQNIPANAVVGGAPARITGYTQTHTPNFEATQGRAVINNHETATQVGVGGVTLHRLKLVRDVRGDLSVGEFQNEVPFLPKRYFLVFDVPSEKVRGEHAHHRCHQFLVCVKGKCAVLVDDGCRRCEIELDAPNMGLYLPPLIWGVQYKYSPDAILLVFTSDYYDPADYIRDYQEFVATVQRSNQSSA